MSLIDKISSIMTKKSTENKLIKEKMSRIIELSEEIQKKARWWYCAAGKPVSREKLEEWKKKYNISLPSEYIDILTVANGFTVDYSSTVGYFRIESFDTERDLEQCFTVNQLNMLKKKIPFKSCFGWINHHCLYFDVFSGQVFIEYERCKYQPVKDLAEEVLEPVIKHLEKELANSEKYRLLLEESMNNPLRPMYDRLLEFAGDGPLPKMNIVLEPPADEEALCRWEAENGMKLPQEYRNWVKISNGSEFGHKFILSLDALRKGYKLDPIDGVEYVILAGLTGCFDYLVFNSQTGEYAVYTEDFELEESAGFEEEIFEDAFEYMEEHMEEE